MTSRRFSRQGVAVGLLGFGTVGSQVYHVLDRNRDELFQKTGVSYDVRKILVRNRDKRRPIAVAKRLLTTRVSEILNDPEIRIVIELVGGLEPAATYIAEAIRSGKSVITANKAVMATHGTRLLSLASRNRVDLLFEASVAGAIPILRPLHESLATDRILEVSGIINGTTNYILTQMTQTGSTFQEALQSAQALGYAEPDPAFDISGMDAAHKIAVLASLAFGCFVRGEAVHREGISRIAPVDIRHAGELGYRIKLVARARLEERNVALSVCPCLVPFGHPLSNVEGPYNAVLVRGERLGDIMFYGQGAGGVPTSTAIVSDLVLAAKNLALGSSGTSVPQKNDTLRQQPMRRMTSRFYLRLHVRDRPGTLAAISQSFASEGLSFSAVLQKEGMGGATDILFLTHRATEGALHRALLKARKHAVVKNVRSVLHIL